MKNHFSYIMLVLILFIILRDKSLEVIEKYFFDAGDCFKILIIRLLVFD